MFVVRVCLHSKYIRTNRLEMNGHINGKRNGFRWDLFIRTGSMTLSMHDVKIGLSPLTSTILSRPFPLWPAIFPH